MFKSTVVLALALLSVADGKRILRGEKKERRTQQKNRQFTLLTNKESQVTAFVLTPGQEITPRGVRRLLTEDKQERRRRELRGGNGGKTGKSTTEESSDGPEFSINLPDDDTFLALTGLSGEILSFEESPGAAIAAICGTTSCRGQLSAIAEGYECDPDEDDFEDTCLDIIVHEDVEDAEFFCPEPTDVMSILTATCVCTGPNPTGTCTVPTMLTFNNPDYVLMPAVNNCGGGGPLAVTATLVCESVIAGSSTSTSTKSGKSKSSSKSKSRRQ